MIGVLFVCCFFVLARRNKGLPPFGNLPASLVAADAAPMFSGHRGLLCNPRVK